MNMSVRIHSSTTPNTLTLDATPPNPIAPASDAPLMPEPQSVYADFAIARLFIENAYTQRKDAREDKRAATASLIESQKAQIAHLREEADKRYAAAQTEAWGKIEEGVMGM